MSRYKVGDRVAILNTTIMGRIIFEGWARVAKAPRQDDDYHDVTFDDGDQEQSFPRMIDPAAQADPVGFAQQLNESLARNP